MSSQRLSVPAAQPKTQTYRLDYLDGLRGLAALYIVLHHAYQEILFSPEVGQIPRRLLSGMTWMWFGSYSVVVFIVLSGYCLMLPVARSTEGLLVGGWRDYLKRRARRILPPYYAALALTLLLIALVPGLRDSRQVRWNLMSLPAFTPGVLLSHLTLVHNLSLAWATKINYPMWSVATEWQIYFLFPALLLPVWRRFGLMALLIVASVLGLLPHFLLPVQHNLDQASPWFLGLFALGMIGACLGFSQQESLIRRQQHTSWGTLAAGCMAAVAVTHLLHLHVSSLVQDMLMGLGAMCLIVFCTRNLSESAMDKHAAIVRLLESRWAALLGAFSYSLYLIHAPLLALLHLALWRLHAPPMASCAAMLVLGPLISVLCAYVFYLRFEKPFTKSRTRPALQAVPGDNN